MKRASAFLALALLLAPPGAARAQSLFAQGGLGVPVGPVDARARGQGSLGIGLFGVSLTPVDPAAAFSIVPTLTVTLQPNWGSFDLGGQTGDLQGQRFPIIGAAYPAFGTRGMFSLSFGGFLDQRWSVVAPDTLILAGEPTPVVDRFDSDGGVSNVRLGYAHRVASSLVLGVNVGALTGQVTRAFERQFDSTAVDAGIDDFRTEGRWRWVGPGAAVGIRWDPNDLLRVSGSVNWYGTLEAQPQDSTPGPTFEFDLPVELRGGANVTLTSELGLNASVYYADWSATGESLAADSLPQGGAAAATLGLGGGVEWSGLGIAGKTFPLRFGYRRDQLPFRFDGETPVETLVAGGLGFNLAQQEGVVLARMDLALERGSRNGGSLSEDFWRFSLSFTAAGL